MNMWHIFQLCCNPPNLKNWKMISSSYLLYLHILRKIYYQGIRSLEDKTFYISNKYFWIVCAIAPWMKRCISLSNWTDEKKHVHVVSPFFLRARPKARPPIITLQMNTSDWNNNWEDLLCCNKFHNFASKLLTFHSFWCFKRETCKWHYGMMIHHISSTYLWQLCTTLSTPIRRSLTICLYRQTSLKQFYTRQLLLNKAIVWWSIWQSFSIIKLLATFEIPYQLDHPLQQPLIKTNNWNQILDFPSLAYVAI